MTQQPGFKLNIPTKLECLKDHIDMASDKDVLFGAGVNPSHSGNCLLLETIDNYLDEYTIAKTKLKQTRICQRIMGIMLRQYGSRFLEKDIRSGRWKTMEDGVAREKIGRIFRRGVRLNEEKQKSDLASIHCDDSGSLELEPISLDRVCEVGWIEDSLVEMHREHGRILEDFLMESSFVAALAAPLPPQVNTGADDNSYFLW